MGGEMGGERAGGGAGGGVGGGAGGGAVGGAGGGAGPGGGEKGGETGGGDDGDGGGGDGGGGGDKGGDGGDGGDGDGGGASGGKAGAPRSVTRRTVGPDEALQGPAVVAALLSVEKQTKSRYKFNLAKPSGKPTSHFFVSRSTNVNDVTPINAESPPSENQALPESPEQTVEFGLYVHVAPGIPTQSFVSTVVVIS